MDIVSTGSKIPAQTKDGLKAIYALEDLVLKCPQHELETHHVIHGGMFARTVHMKADEVMTGALINVPTMLIINGDAKVLIGSTAKIFTGFNVIPASAGRKQAFVALTDLDLTMIFSTSAQTIADAEEEFTAEAHRLISRQENALNFITVTGE